MSSCQKLGLFLINKLGAKYVSRDVLLDRRHNPSTFLWVTYNNSSLFLSRQIWVYFRHFRVALCDFTRKFARNALFLKFRSKHSSNTVVCLLRYLMNKSLLACTVNWLPRAGSVIKIFFVKSQSAKLGAKIRSKWSRDVLLNRKYYPSILLLFKQIRVYFCFRINLTNS